MKTKTTLLLSVTTLVGLGYLSTAGLTAKTPRSPAYGAQQAAAGQQAGTPKQPNWKSTDEYNAFQAMLKEPDPQKRIGVAEAFLQKFGATTDFKDQAYQIEMVAHQQLNESAKAIEAAHKAVEANPDNIAALNYLSYAFPFVFKTDAADKDAQLAQAEADAKRGLETLQKLQKPANVSDDQFNQQVKVLRANFNGALGFVALQKKDYTSAITSLKAAQ